MEAVPRLPMLAFELKHSPEYVDFGPTLKKYIHDYYGEDPALYNKACSDLDQLRQNAIHVTRDFVGCATLKRYYAQLHFLHGRFPMGEGGEASVTFTWEDNQTGRDHMIADIKFEQACILYNIGALHSNLGAIDTRQNAEGMKVSCTHFQCAAWAFEYLRDHFGSSSMSTDMSHELLTFHINVMLAQAQECILEKSMIDSRKNTITAKVSAQVVEFYRVAVKNLDQCNAEQVINSRSYKDWRKRLELKVAFYQCITNYYMGRHAEDQQKWGERLAYFQVCQNHLNEAVKFAKNEVPEMQEALRFAQDVVGGKLAAAQKDNDFIYHEKVPPIESLPEVKGAPLVKGIPFDPTDAEISGPDIFQKLVPMEAHEAASVYSEEKAKLLRQVGGEIESKNAELDQFMNSLQIDQSIFDHLPDRLPQELLGKCAAMSVRTNAIKELIDAMSGISGLATETEMNIKELQELIAEDSRKTEEFEQQFGKKMISTVLPSLSKDCEAHLEKHFQGSQLNSTLHAAMNTHITNLRLLVLPPDELQRQLPPAKPPRSAEDEDIISEMRRLLSKIEEMKNQRSSLENQLREQLQKDDITSVLVAQESSRESIYKTQLKKHDAVVSLITQNLNAQSNILRALTDTNAKFATLRQAALQYSAKREAVVKDLINSFEKYEELLAKSQKGQEYYCRLNEAVMKTLERCRSECKVRQEERDMLVTKYAPKAPPPSRPSAPKPGQPPQPSVPATAPASMTAAALAVSASVGEEFDGHPPTSTVSAPLSAFEGPRLKDYLPFMKPQSFGPNRSTPSPQSLPPGSPDVTLSGPPSLSSDSSSPKHRSHAVSNNADPTAALPHGIQGHVVGMAYSAPDVTAITNTPARDLDTQRPSMPGTGHQQLHTSPPDITANIPITPGQALQYASLSDVSHQSLSTGRYPHFRQTDVPGVANFSSLPRDSAGGLGQGRYQDFMAGSFLPERVSSPSSSTDSMASSGSLHPGYGLDSSTSLTAGQGLPYMASGSAVSAQLSSSVSSTTLPHSIPPHIQQQQIQMGQSFQPPHIQQQQQPQPGQNFQPPPQQQQQQPGRSFQPPPQQQQQQPGQSFQPPPQQQQQQPGQSFQPPPQQQQQQPGQSFQQPPQQQQQQPGVYGQVPKIVPQQGLIRPDLPSSQVLHPSTVSSSTGYQLQQGMYVSGRVSASGHIPQLMTGYSTAGGAGPTAVNQAYPGQSLQQYLPATAPQHTQPQLQGQSGQHLPQSALTSAQSHMTGAPGTVPANVSALTHPSQQPAIPMSTSYQGQQTWGMHSGVQGGYTQPTFGGHASTVGQHSQSVSASQIASNVGNQDAASRSFGGPGSAMVAAQPGQLMPQHQQQQFSAVMQQSQQPSGQMAPYLPPQPASGPALSFANQFQATGQRQVPQHGTGSQRDAAAPFVAGSQAPPGPQSYPAAASMTHPLVQQTPQSSQQIPYFSPGVLPGTSASNLPGSQPSQLHPQQQPRPPDGSANFGILQGIKQGPSPAYGSTQQFTASQGVHPQVPATPPAVAGQTTGYIQQQQQQQLPGYRDQQPQVQSAFPGSQSQYAQQPIPQQTVQHFQPVRQQQVAGHHQSPGSQYSAPQQQQYSLAEQKPPAQFSQFSLQPLAQQPEAHLIFPTPLQPSRVQSADAIPSPQQVVVPFATNHQQLGPQPVQVSSQDLTHSTTPSLAQPHLPAQTVVQSPVQPPHVSGQSSVSTVYSTSLSRQKSSLDELLSSSPEDSKKSSIPDPIITPKVLTDQEKQQQKEEAMKTGGIVEKVKDPYENSCLLNKFVSDVEAFGKFVDELSVSILGVSRLDTVWKSIIDSQDHELKKHSIAIARCYPLKNRDPDIMPYDETRVVLSTTKDDYINASWVNDLAPSCPKFVATQAPLGVTLTDFWIMVYELGSEVIVQISSDYETGKNFPVYYPTEKGQQMEQGPIVLTLQSVKYRQLWTERNVYLKHSQTKQGRTVIHLQFKTWPVSGFPDDVQHVCRFISEVHSFYQQQRSLLKPIIVHCGSGIGRTGAFLLIYTGMQEILHGSGMIDIRALAKRMLQKRKNIIHKKEQLKFCYDALLCFAEDFLKKRNILVHHPHFEKKQKIAEPPPQPSHSDDIVLGSVDLQTIQQTVGRLHIHDDKEKAVPSAGDETDQAAATLPASGKEPDAFAALPDLIQQQPRNSDSGVVGSLSGLQGFVAEDRSSGVASPKTHSRSGSNASMHSLGSLVGSGSSRSSPQHGPSPALSVGGVAAASLSQTLADLQDPKKFTLGKAEQKKRITRDSFDKKGASAGLEAAVDPDDPLSSLDPMWISHKPRQQQSNKN